MSNLLEQNLANIYAEKQNKIIPNNIKAGVTVLGIEGTLEPGVDTSDADATATDILKDKTAYVNGEKITGALDTTSLLKLKTVESIVRKSDADSRLYFDNNPQSTQLVGISTDVRACANYADIAAVIGLTADKIKAGETILGITGTYEGEQA